MQNFLNKKYDDNVYCYNLRHAAVHIHLITMYRNIIK